MRVAFSPAEHDTNVRLQPVIVPQPGFGLFGLLRKRPREAFDPIFGLEFLRVHACISVGTTDNLEPATLDPA